MRTPNDLVTQQEAADSVGCHYNTIKNWRIAGFIRWWRQGRTVLVSLKEVERAANPKVERGE